MKAFVYSLASCKSTDYLNDFIAAESNIYPYCEAGIHRYKNNVWLCREDLSLKRAEEQRVEQKNGEYPGLHNMKLNFISRREKLGIIRPSDYVDWAYSIIDGIGANDRIPKIDRVGVAPPRTLTT